MVVLLAVLAACGGAGEAIDDLGDESVFSMEIGLCFNDEADAGTEVASVPDVDCAEPHDNEVFALAEYTATDTYPGSEAMNAEAKEICIGLFDDYVGLAYEESVLEVYPITPTQGSWDNGDREIVCALYEADLAKLTGSMQGAAR
jgi:hypothetical protein